MSFDFNSIDVESSASSTYYKDGHTTILQELLSSEIDTATELELYDGKLISVKDLFTEGDNEKDFLKTILQKIELIGKESRVYQLNDKHDTVPQNIALDLLKQTATSEYNLKRGFLDARLDSRLYESRLGEIFDELKGKSPSVSGTHRVYPIDDTTALVVIPLNEWTTAPTLTVQAPLTDKTVYLFVDEAGTKNTIAGQRFPNPETILFRGVYKSTPSGQLILQTPRLHLNP